MALIHENLWYTIEGYPQNDATQEKRNAKTKKR